MIVGARDSRAPPIPHASYNKREEDFETKEAYDDYLEEREDISTC